MQAIVIIVAAILTVVVAQSGHNEQHHHENYIDYHAHPYYHFDYSVHNLKHHDIKQQWETRDGEHVKGLYSLVQPDHKVRTVKYEADKHGFNAQIHYEGNGHSHYQSLGGGLGGRRGGSNGGGSGGY